MIRDGSVAVIIVNWNGEAVIGPCIESLLRQEYASRVEIVVVDNASTDGSVPLLRGYGDSITLIASDENLGFGRGNNEGFRAADTEFVVCLNPDTEVLEVNGLTTMLAWFADPSIGLVGPRIVNRDGSTQQSCSSVPSLTNLVTSAVALPRLLPSGLRRRYAPVLWEHDRSAVVGWVGGACVAMRASQYLEIGGFSERTFMYGEDLELGYQVAQLGLKVFYDYDTRVLHLGDHSSTQAWSNAETAARTASGEMMFLHERYNPRKAELGRRILWFTYAARAFVLGRLGRPRAAVYWAMSQALTRDGAPARLETSRSSLTP